MINATTCRSFVSGLLTLFVLFHVFPSTVVKASEPELTLIAEQTLAHGVVHKHYTITFPSNDAVTFNVVEVQLDHPYVKLSPMYGSEIGSKARVTTMVYEAGAVAGINASFFNMNNEGGTFGAIVKDGEILSNPAESSGWQTFAVLENQTAIIQELGFTGTITTPDGQTFPLSGINKTEYWPSGSQASNYSGSVHMFTKAWGENSRGIWQQGDRSILDEYQQLIEVEVTDGIVTDIRYNAQPQPIPENGYVLMGHGKGLEFLHQLQLGDPVHVSYELTPHHLDIEQAIGANYLLVEEGRKVETMPEDSALSGRNSRSAIGITENGKRLFMVTVDRDDSNPGVTLSELADILLALGSDRGVNLDGGGSTSMVVRLPGETNITRLNSSAYERRVADALGIFNIAPKGDAAVLELSGRQTVLQYDQSGYTVFGYDTNYHPISALDVLWTVGNGAGTVKGNKVKWNESGEHYVQVSYNGKEATLPVRVLGEQDIEKLVLEPSVIIVRPNQTVKLEPSLLLTDGSTFPLTGAQVKWSLDPQIGQVQGLELHASDSETKGTLVADVLGVKAEFPVIVGHSFIDIIGHWAQDDIEFLAKQGYARGFEDGTYEPSQDLTRAELIVFLSRVLNWEITEQEKAYQLNESVPAFAQEAIKYAIVHGIIQGDENGRIHASRAITRTEMAVILERILDAQPNSPEALQDQPLEEMYTDADDIPAWGRDAVKYVTDRQIFGGSDGQFQPRSNITRAEVAAVLVRSFFRN